MSVDEVLEAQKQVCAVHGVDFCLIEPDAIVGASRNHGLEAPTHGLRHADAGDSSGWFLWSGEYSAADDFFEPVHLRHLIERAPEVIRYLALPPGFRFLNDDACYEDIWFDEALLLP
ncbi:hypothetical protein F0P96_19860 [Hymenobacter busanensis]|uniref:Imm33-like domain-containing protein n=1 Tax=Hymenobacter busanensis TaxID=2607656 RepID=A0A7L4ZXU7_9BACT|nr:hypothetical protein [Hymenobacter busanensis]KAA9325585.1 hypothetical protein F0P96_19860 [Hymenobacter busanensis]QHJ07743.1 hypothetical protein GUY19_10805 [Hymenobacter busanensis]